jgi:hypothetical protein
VAGDRLRIVMSCIMRRRSGLNPTISLLLFSRLRFNSRNPSKQKRHPQTDPPNAAIAVSLCAQHVRPLGGASPLANLMEVKA